MLYNYGKKSHYYNHNTTQIILIPINIYIYFSLLHINYLAFYILTF